MSGAIKIRGRYATVRDTAKTLGVSAARTEQLIEMARHATRNLFRDGKTGELVSKRRSATESRVSRAANNGNFISKSKNGTSTPVPAASSDKSHAQQSRQSASKKSVKAAR